MEKVKVYAEVEQDAADRIVREIRRQEFVEELTKLTAEIRKAGFRICPANPKESFESKRNRVLFSDTILLPYDN